MEENSDLLKRRKLLIIFFPFGELAMLYECFFLLRKDQKFGKAWVEILLALSLAIGGSYVALSLVF